LNSSESRILELVVVEVVVAEGSVESRILELVVVEVAVADGVVVVDGVVWEKS